MSGKLIVFEGVEGGGKTTQIELAKTWLCSQLGKNVPVVVTREPGGTDLGQKIRQLLLKEETEPIGDRTELLLYAADRAQHVSNFLQPWLDKKALILCDRYTDSTIAYQGYGRGIDLNLIRQLNEIATGGLESDLTIWFDVEVEIGLSRAKKRGASDRIEQAEIAFHRRVQQGFTELAATNKSRFVRVDANLPVDQVQKQIEQIFREFLFSHG
ncbi:MAG: dTMP kinase [Oscillatoria sp. PMC 1068.18]|nr:dTMP kinase [Oscillatoria sp. PMC 1076.18]MEC4991438.1 dTMP kinase [Oscillatoria sp. PMC 1068.18]